MDINGKLIHFTGIGGVSMSALACFAILNGAYVTGSDIRSICNKSYLDSLGIISYIGSDAVYASNADMLVYTSATDETDPEVIAAKRHNVPVFKRHEFLSLIAGSYRDVIAVSGAHGKTTTTAMLSHILNTANYSYAAHIGGYSYDISGNYCHKGNELFVTEACEYKRSFLSLKPTLAIILNIDHDHPDTYKTKEDMFQAFREFSFSSKITLAYSGFEKHISPNEHIITFGYENSNFTALNIDKDIDEKYHFDLYLNERLLISDIRLPVYGRHNILNATAAGAAAAMWGVPADIIKKSLNTYRGVGRRFEIKGNFNGALIISDYAHHPTEIRATALTARNMTKGKLILIYEPHTYSRTKAFIDEFENCFSGADRLIILPTYAAREFQGKGMDSRELINRIKGVTPEYAEDYYSAREMALKDAGKDDTLLIVGAGTIEKLAAMMCEYNL
ncbi:MAG: UDP-N-acetylmuramate--L-alanine ligase [Christensenellales bacterium]|jgi:UDP-N-acetylmuramate--alanine ligase